MSTRRWLTCSVLLNLLLSGLWFAHRGSAIAPVSRIPTRTSVGERPPVVAQHLDRKKQQFSTVEVQPLSWVDLQAQDLKQFSDNLRNAGCPKETLFLIILNEIRQQALPRITAVVDEVRDRYYEELAAAEGDFFKIAKPQVEKLEALAEELDDLLEKSAGRPSWSSFDADASQIRSQTALLEVLSPDEVRGVFEVRGRYAEEISGIGGRAHQRSKEEIEKSESDELKVLLGEKKYAELKLMESSEASVIRARPGLEATPEEWGEILAIQRACQATNAPAAVLTQTLARVIGPERATEFEDYARPEYRDFAELIQEAGLPRSLIKQACEIEAAFKKQEQEVKLAPMPDMLKRTERQALEAKRQSALLELLGEEPAEAYEQARPKH